MKAKFIIPILAIAAQLTLAFWPLIPGLKTLLPSTPTQREQMEWILQFTGFSFAIMTACVALLLVSNEENTKAQWNRLHARLTGALTQKLRDDQFYNQFLAAARQAKSSVNIMYLAPRPPDATFDQERLNYYRDMLALIKGRKDVRFNRIVRNTGENKPWIAKLLVDLNGCPNASVCMLKDHDSADDPLSLSTQIVDGERAWLVALSGHERTGDYRDLLIESKEVAEALQLYFQRIWGRGDELMSAGRISAAGERLLTQISAP